MRLLTHESASTPGSHIRGLAAIVVVAWLLSACAGLNGASSNAYAPVSTSAAPAFPATRATHIVNGRFCGDATGSTSNTMPRFGSTMRSSLASAVRGWAHNAPADLAGGASAQPGLSLQVRWVNTDPLADANALTVSIPSVAGLVREPAASSATFVADDQTWQQAAGNVKSGAQTAVTRAAAAASSINAFRWPHGSSGISACITALIQDLPAGHDVLLVASDGEQNEPPQVGGNLHGADVLWVMPNPSGNASHEASLQASWKKLLIKLGSRSVKFIRPETATATLFANFLKGA